MKAALLIIVGFLVTVPMGECWGQRVPGKSIIDESTAIKLAAGYAGVSLPGAATNGVRITTAFTNALPSSLSFMQISNGPAWKVVFGGVEITAMSNGSLRRNSSIHEVTAWVGAEDGALLGIFTPPPPDKRALSLPAEQGEIVEQGFSLKRTTATPKVPFLSLLHSAPGHLYSARDATQITAFFGLLTDSARPRYGIVDKPYWVIILAGVRISVPSGPAPGGGAGVSTICVTFAGGEDGHVHYEMAH